MRTLTSASNIFRRDLCAGSAAAEADFREEPENDESEYSIEGTMLHHHDAVPDLDRSHLSHEQVEVLKKSESIDIEIFEAVELHLENPGKFDEGREREMVLRKGFKAVFPGHCDRWRYYPDHKVLVIIDKKFGRNDVTPAEANLQLRSYAVMGAKEFGAERIVVAIVQPRKPREERLTLAEYTADDLPAAKDHLLSVYYKSHNEDGSPKTDAPRFAGEEQCRYCAARVHCEERNAAFNHLAEVKVDDFKAQIQRLTPEQADKSWRAVKLAKAIEDDLKAYMMSLVESGSLTNYEAKPTGNMSTITDPVSAAKLLAPLGFTVEDVLSRSRIALDKLADDYHDRNPALTVKDSKIAIRDAVSPVLDVKPKAPSLKRTGPMLPAPKPTPTISNDPLFQ